MFSAWHWLQRAVTSSLPGPSGSTTGAPLRWAERRAAQPTITAATAARTNVRGIART
jgi:hypothetical protein